MLEVLLWICALAAVLAAPVVVGWPIRRAVKRMEAKMTPEQLAEHRRQLAEAMQTYPM